MLNLKLKGQLIAVYDLKMALDSANHGCNVVFIGDTVGMAQYQNVFIPGGSFVPNIEAMQALVNGQNENFYNMYIQQLIKDPFVHEFLDTVVCALYQGRTVILYIPENAVDFHYHDILFQFIQNVYGIHTQTDAKHPYFQEFGFIPVLDALFNYNQIDAITYLACLPDCKLSDEGFVKVRLCPMFHFEMNNDSINTLRVWKESMNASNRPLNMAIRFEDSSK